ncbi:MAG: hypothetical protein QOH97_3617 [Actinoplanes sp.]|jgi:hypothetical protein|nr:hypothetical protein [Actinoplanes sp.]
MFGTPARCGQWARKTTGTCDDSAAFHDSRPHTSSGMLSGMVSGMRTKTSLTLDEDSIPLARSRAEAEGLDVGRWLDRAIRHEAARGDVDIIADWEASLPPDDQTVLAALDAADRHDLDTA